MLLTWSHLEFYKEITVIENWQWCKSICCNIVLIDLIILLPHQKHCTGFPQALEIMENLENQEKSSMHGKIMEFEKTWIIMEKSWNFVK